MRALLIIGVLLVAGVATVGVADVERTIDDAVRDLEPDEIHNNETREAFGSRLNEFRANNSLAPLNPDDRLESMANGHSRHMARSGFQHGDSSARLRSAGCTGGGGENIAYTYLRTNIDQEYDDIYIDSADDLARALFLQWYHSPPHREIMLSEGVDRFGLGLFVTEDDKVFATLDIC